MNDLKKIKIWGVFLVFMLAFLLHFLYEILPNPVFAIISPVNESIWEHMKLLLSSYVIYGVIEYWWLKKKNYEFNNYFLQLGLVPLLGIIIYLVIYLPLYNIFGENMVISIALLFIVIVIEEIISYMFLKRSDIKYEKIIGIFIIFIMYMIFVVLTYNPIKNYIFYDTKNQFYGIK